MVFDDFVIVEKTPRNIIEKYKGKIPYQVIEVWEKYGFGSLKNGYLRVINPDDFKEILLNTYEDDDLDLSIPLFITAMGDILVWDNEYLLKFNYRRNEVKVIAAGFDYFFEDLNDEYYLEDALEWLPYPVAIKEYGEPAFDECFGYVPILGIGGSEKIENLQKVKFLEHIYLITQLVGPIDF
ncbi:T6SS immunity protein Tdi1 domain-containing protein [Cytobacillus sp. IB215316]|uniref:T6SS immunity protein Tdi1 domain-containing protein n=1 Tax=Cytobacillus sp. IB215316 TaxID=3097354 RepID=UPI0039B761DE